MIFGPGVDVESCAYVDETVRLFGKVTAEEGVTIWPYAVMRSEMKSITIGKMTNIQDFVMIHIGTKTGTHVGKYCSITHHCTLHGCTIGDYTLVGINSTIMDGCVIGDNCIIAGHTFLKEGTVIPDNSIVMGTPGKVVKTTNSKQKNKLNAVLYYKNGLAYNKGQHRAWDGINLLQDMDKTLKSALDLT
ncbi:gamma carbonic anhydrase family protein [Pseudobacteriovorax antillogorgiicola]|uniref:Carbonic anhydrase or acetyltransferase, isoleucine patch superfamily n=1 Tax=Pseudobacteriovorax antillogorgiicola TaxID=1513793 RepID=A0A1Y6BD65_9BACT|nr:gamma carbonic anhydrase family protein [Pseudobacteriovorax antillogorgiicola]TCS58792.1 carbonic anhydrase/acetyltransferase-like protein (isoleucine patch superfamily) [Pseudobacteriovorax antillogorgiicola]SME94678.1 Carbonic anhydrase or acetyltransferase, isoleucine patch superfamily [Pseudobacteriovorax antillogorgiicola]